MKSVALKFSITITMKIARARAQRERAASLIGSSRDLILIQLHGGSYLHKIYASKMSDIDKKKCSWKNDTICKTQTVAIFPLSGKGY